MTTSDDEKQSHSDLDTEADTEPLGDQPDATASRKQDFPEWEKEHGVDYGDYLDSLLDPDDPLHEVARAAAKDDPNIPRE